MASATGMIIFLMWTTFGISSLSYAGKAQFRRRASAVPNLIVIWFDCSTAGKQLWFRRRARVEPNSAFTDAS